MVGLLPLYAAMVFESVAIGNHPRIMELVDLFVKGILS
jgi:hypothetical protein